MIDNAYPYSTINL